MTNFKKILGLDLGTASIGYAMVERSDDGEFGGFVKNPKGHEAIGVRVIPTTDDVLNAYNKGQSVSACRERTSKRGSRRLLQRYKARRERLITTLKHLGWLNINFPSLESRQAHQYRRVNPFFMQDSLRQIAQVNGWPEAQSKNASFVRAVLTKTQVEKRQKQFIQEFAEKLGSKEDFWNEELLVYYLRHLGVTERLELEEIALVLYHLNQRRGFKSSRKTNNEDDKDKNQGSAKQQEAEEDNSDYKDYEVLRIEGKKHTLKDPDTEEEFVVNVSQEHQPLFKEKTVFLSIEKSGKTSKYHLPKAHKTVTLARAEVKFIKYAEETEIKGKKFKVYRLRLVVEDKTMDGDMYFTLENNGAAKNLLEEGKACFLEITESTDAKGETTRTFKRAKLNEWAKNKEKVKEELEKNLDPRTQKPIEVASLHLQKMLDGIEQQSAFAGTIYSTRDQIILRKFYIRELQAIMSKQAELHKGLVQEQEILGLLDRLYQNDGEGDKQTIKGKDGHKIEVIKKGKTYKDEVKKYLHKTQSPDDTLRHLLEKHIIYYQRPLKSQTNSISTCRFETQTGKDGKPVPVRVAPISAPYAQEYRIWNQINSLMYAEEDETKKERPLSPTDKAKLFEMLCNSKEVGVGSLAKKLWGKNPAKVEFNKKNDIKLKGHDTRCDLKNVLKKAQSDQDRMRLEEILANAQQFELLWHLLYSIEADLEAEPIRNPIVKTLQKRFGFSEAGAVLLSKVQFKNDYSALSKRAILKILPLMRSGCYFDAQKLPNKAHDLLQSIKNGLEMPDIDPKTYKTLHSANLEGGWLYHMAASLLYGSHSREENLTHFSEPAEIKAMRQHSLRNPVVEKVVNEVLLLVKELWENFGRPDEIRIELAREMRMNAQEREQMTRYIGAREKANKQAAANTGLTNPSKNDVLRYQLWDKAGEKCVYSGKKIRKEDVFNHNITQVDHIIPRARFFDDSAANKVLVFTEENKAKSDKTAYDYMKSKGPEALESYKKDIACFKDQKQKYKHLLMRAEDIPDDFINRQLKETQYITKKAKELLRAVVPEGGQVWVTSGGVTDYLRHIWGLDTLMQELLRPRYEAMQEKSKEALKGQKLIFDKETLDKETGEIQTQEVFLNFSKRLDHRHHALDALVIACTTQGHVQLLNNKNKVYGQNPQMHAGELTKVELLSPEALEKMTAAGIPEGGERNLTHKLILQWAEKQREAEKMSAEAGRKHKKGGPTRFAEPFKNTRKLAQNALENIVVSVKSKKEMRGKLHDELPLGEVWVNEKVKIAELFKLIVKPDAYQKIPTPLAWLEAKLRERLAECQNNLKKAQKSLQEKPIRKANGQEIEEVTLLKAYLVKRRKIESLSEKQIEDILDEKLKTAIKEELLGGIIPNPKQLKEMLSEQNITAFNELRKAEGLPPATHVRTKASPLNADTQETNKKLANKKYATKGNNFCFVVGVNLDKNGNKKRVFGAVPLADALESGLEPEAAFLTENQATLAFKLVQNDVVYVPYEGQNMREVDFRNASSRLFRIKKFTGPQIFLEPLNMSSALKFDVNDEISTNGIEIVDKGSKAAKNYFYKLKTNRLGHIEGYWNDEGVFVKV